MSRKRRHIKPNYIVKPITFDEVKELTCGKIIYFFGDLMDGCGNILGNRHQLTVALAGLVDLNRTNIHTGNYHAKGIAHSLRQIIFDSIVDLCRLAFDLNNRNVVSRRGIGNCVLNVAVCSIPDLLLEIIQIKAEQSM